MDLAESPDVAIPMNDLTALDKVLVGLRIVETADDRPHGRDRGRYFLDDGGAALVGAYSVGVVAHNRVRDLRLGWAGEWYREDSGGGGRWWSWWLLLRLFTRGGYGRGSGAKGGRGVDPAK